MKKNVLDIEYHVEFDCIAIRTPTPGYQMAWELNRVLNIQLKKINDWIITEPVKNSTEDVTFHFDHYFFESSVFTLRLLKNKNNDEQRISLIPEYEQFDYLFLYTRHEELDSKRLQDLINQIPSVNLTTFIHLPNSKWISRFII